MWNVDIVLFFSRGRNKHHEEIAILFFMILVKSISSVY
jgi:hypothetical protein